MDFTSLQCIGQRGQKQAHAGRQDGHGQQYFNPGKRGTSKGEVEGVHSVIVKPTVSRDDLRKF